jgi:prephenate dehydrogenase
MTSVLIIGTGLIGTSIGLALGGAAGGVWLRDDYDPAVAALAADLGAGVLHDGRPVDLAVIGVPPDAVAPTLLAAQRDGLARFYTDVASVKQMPVSQAAAAGCDMSVFVPGHPLAGREKHGPAAARADLFLGRTWALCSTPWASADAVAAVERLIAGCGATRITTDPATHDRWVALTSHAPHVVAAAMAARLENADAKALDLAGQGLRDVTRIAAGDTALWGQILAGNAAPVAEVLAEVAADLAEVARLLGEDSAAKVCDLLDRGRAGVARIPGKHGSVAPVFTQVQVVIRDQPGELRRLFDVAGTAGVNIEDIRIEHSPGLPAGVAELSVRPDEAAALLRALREGGWKTYS